jgi:hypothetical protein
MFWDKVLYPATIETMYQMTPHDLHLLYRAYEDMPADLRGRKYSRGVYSIQHNVVKIMEKYVPGYLAKRTESLPNPVRNLMEKRNKQQGKIQEVYEPKEKTEQEITPEDMRVVAYLGIALAVVEFIIIVFLLLTLILI